MTTATAFAPGRSTDLLHGPGSRDIAAGIMQQVADRGKLELLLSLYSDETAEKLYGLYAANAMAAGEEIANVAAG